MQGAQHEVAGERGFDRHFGGLAIPNLADHDHVGISTEERPHGRSKRKADFGMNLNLPKPPLGDLDRIFGRPDLAIGGVNIPQRRMQCRGFARAGWPGAQDKPVRLLEHLLPFPEIPSKSFVALRAVWLPQWTRSVK